MDGLAQTNAEVELKHIMVELVARRSYHMRHFIDHYFCFSHGYVGRSGTPDWDAILWNEYVSENAETLHDGARYDFVTRDHIVPIAHIISELKNLGEPSEGKIADLLNRRLAYATITKEKDARLNAAGLKSKMPEEFSDENHHLFGEKLARYKKIGIVLNYRGTPNFR